MPPRLRWYLRFLLRTLLALPALVLLLWLVLFIFNRFDEKIDPATAAWLNYPPPTAEPDKNSYLMLLALTSQDKDPMAA